ncbi:MAG: Mrp/NBP35 family ATP-binding protein [Pseudomonadales bacterium]|nr:Mrp/NBP35 family ATP-binding protein [Pseudomonadales bacterium]
MSAPLDRFADPLIGETWSELGAIRRTGDVDGTWTADVVLGYPIDGWREQLEDSVRDWLGSPSARLDLTFQAPDARPLQGVKNIIAVASGKGGVGKSTIAVNLALGLLRAGAKTGLLDADIYGPSQGRMLGIPEGRRPEMKSGNRLVPMRAHGLKAMSMSMLVTDRTPMVWRGPMASGALKQLLQQTDWQDLDYLVVDMPPGTGDIQLTLTQAVSLSGAVIVTTPQEIALADARKGVEMFTKVSVPVLGVIENMSSFRCDGCGKEHAIFDQHGGQRVAEEYGTGVVGRFPLDTNLRSGADVGQPTVAADPTHALAKDFVDTARLVAATVWRSARLSAPPPKISMGEA